MQRPLLWLPSRARTKAFLILLQKAQCSLPAPGLFVCGTGNQNEVGIWRSSSWGLWFTLKGTVKVAACPSRLPVLCDRDFMGTAGCHSCSDLKNRNPESGRCRQAHEHGLIPLGRVLQITPWGRQVMSCSDTSLWMRHHPLSQGWSWAGQGDTPCHILAKLQPQHPLPDQSPLCLPGKQKEWELLLLQNLGKTFWLWTLDKALTEKFLFAFHTFLFSRVIPSPLPQSSCPHWRGFWFCFQSLQENDSSFSRKPHLVESRFPQWWNDAGCSRSAALVLCQERGILSLYFRIPSLISALCPNTTKNKNYSQDPSFNPFMSFDTQMESWTVVLQVFLGPSWFWKDLWFDETKMLQEALMWMLVDLRFVLNFWGFLYFFILVYTEIFLFLLFWLFQEVVRAHPMPLDCWKCPCLPRGLWAGHW